MKIYFILILSSFTFVLNAQNNGFLRVFEDNEHVDVSISFLINSKDNAVLLSRKYRYNSNPSKDGIISLIEININNEIINSVLIEIDSLFFFNTISHVSESIFQKDEYYYLSTHAFNLYSERFEPYLIKLDENFNIVWLKHYPPRKDNFSVYTYTLGGIREIDNNILLLGYSSIRQPLYPGFITLESNLEILKVDTDGNLLMQNFIVCDSCITLNTTFTKVNNNLFLIAGSTTKNRKERISEYINPFEALDGFVYAVDSNGTLLYEFIKETFASDNFINIFDEYGTFTQEVETNWADSTRLFEYSALLMGQLNPFSGQILWEDTVSKKWVSPSTEQNDIDSSYTENNFLDGQWAVAKQLRDGGFILARRFVNVLPNDTTQATMFVRFDNQRNILWKRKYYYEEDVWGTFQGNIIEDSEGYFWHQGYAWYKFDLQKPQNQWVLRMDPYGCINENDCGIPEPLPTYVTENSIYLYPNPAKDVVKLFVANEPKAKQLEIAIVNPTGQLMYKNQYQTNEESLNIEINVSNFASGWYALYVNYGKKDLKVIKFIKN